MHLPSPLHLRCTVETLPTVAELAVELGPSNLMFAPGQRPPLHHTLPNGVLQLGRRGETTTPVTLRRNGATVHVELGALGTTPSTVQLLETVWAVFKPSDPTRWIDAWFDQTGHGGLVWLEHLDDALPCIPNLFGSVQLTDAILRRMDTPQQWYRWLTQRTWAPLDAPRLLDGSLFQPGQLALLHRSARFIEVDGLRVPTPVLRSAYQRLEEPMGPDWTLLPDLHRAETAQVRNQLRLEASCH